MSEELKKAYENPETSICFSGHRSEKLPHGEQLEQLRTKVWDEVNKAISEGIITFYVGMCYGFDLLVADIVLMRKRVIKPTDPENINLIGVIPFENQASAWKSSDRELYFDTLAKCDDTITISARYQKGCYHERNRYMVDRSSRLVCYYDGGTGGTKYTKDYAEKNNLKITNLY